VRLYRKGLEVVYEALALPAPSAGLGPKADSVTLWRGELNTWQANVRDRCAPAGHRCRCPPPPLLPLPAAAAPAAAAAA
jgi:hypothetical protein